MLIVKSMSRKASTCCGLHNSHTKQVLFGYTVPILPAQPLEWLGRPCMRRQFLFKKLGSTFPRAMLSRQPQPMKLTVAG